MFYVKDAREVKKMHTTAVLSISNVGMKCQDIVQLFYKMGIAASVSNNSSVTKNSMGTYTIEPGCRIIFKAEKKHELKSVWNKLKSSQGLTCGHIEVAGKFAGCTKEYFKE